METPGLSGRVDSPEGVSCRSEIWSVFLIRFTKDSPRFKDELEIMKYICKDFWTAVYKKQIDNLRTNHQVCVANGTGLF